MRVREASEMIQNVF